MFHPISFLADPQCDQPVFSGDGRWVIHSSDRGGAINLWRAPFDGGAPEAITSGPGSDSTADVSRDGRRIVFINSRTDTRIVAVDPQVVGITTMTQTLLDVLRIIEIVRARAKLAQIVLGGPHTHLFPEESIALPGVDLVVMGEGERSFAQALERLGDPRGLLEIPGLVFHQGDRIVHTGTPALIEDLDALPFPAQLEQSLRASHPDRQIDVIPLAVPGYTSAQGLAWLRREIARLQPDAVIICFHNDECVDVIIQAQAQRLRARVYSDLSRVRGIVQDVSSASSR